MIWCLVGVCRSNLGVIIIYMTLSLSQINVELLCLGSLPCSTTQSGLSDRWPYIWLYNTFAYSRVHGSITARPPQPLAAVLCLTACMRSLLIRCVWLLSNVILWIMVKHLHLSLVFLKDIGWEILWFDEMQICKPKLCCQVKLNKIKCR